MINTASLNDSILTKSKFKVYQHWDPLQVCVVGRSYPPEFYSFVKNIKIRKIFEKLAQETEEDFQHLVKKLESFNVEVWRPTIPEINYQVDQSRGQYREPPMTPRDDHVMIGDQFFIKNNQVWKWFYDSIKDAAWPQFPRSIKDLPEKIQKECREIFRWGLSPIDNTNPYYEIIQKIKQNNQVSYSPQNCINGASVARLGKDIIIGTDDFLTQEDRDQLKNKFSNFKLHLLPSDGHFDGSYCPVCPGLIISHRDVPTYQDTFPDWEVLQVSPTLESIPAWAKYREKTRNRWWMPGFESDDLLVEVVETYLNRFVGFVDETCFEVNMLMINPTNAITFFYNSKVEKTLQRYGINLHVIPFRHRYFWDGGAHCVTCDIDRQGHMKKIL